MYCTRCGAANDVRAGVCTGCGRPMPQIAGPEAVREVFVPNYLVPAMLTTLCCCLPLGIPAIVFAIQATGRVRAGDAPGSLEASRKARLWCWIAFGTGLGLVVLWILFALLGALMRRSS